MEGLRTASVLTIQESLVHFLEIFSIELLKEGGERGFIEVAHDGLVGFEVKPNDQHSIMSVFSKEK